MKLNLLLDSPGDVRAGFVNVDPFADEGDPVRLRCKLDDLERVVDANEATQIVAHDVLDRFASECIDAVLEHWLSRLAHGGTLALSVVDAREVARSLLAGRIGLDDFNVLVHGESGERCCTLTLERLCDALETRGMKVVKRRVENHRAVVICERP